MTGLVQIEPILALVDNQMAGSVALYHRNDGVGVLEMIEVYALDKDQGNDALGALSEDRTKHLFTSPPQILTAKGWRISVVDAGKALD